jgi:hypothetical protein
MEIEEKCRLNSPKIWEEKILATRMNRVQLLGMKQTIDYK